MKTPRLLKLFPLIAALALTVQATAVTLPEQLLPGLDGILKKAVQQSPRMLGQALALEMAENSRVAARAPMLPNIGAYASYLSSSDHQSLLYDTPTGSSSNTYTLTKTPYAVYLSQPLYHWGALQNAAKIGEIQHSIAQGQYREAYRALVQVLRGEYMRLIILKETSARAAYNLETITAQAQQEEERLRKKLISDADIFGVRIGLERAQISAEQASFDFQNALRSFVRLAGLGTGFTEADVPETIPDVPYEAESLNQLLAGFLAQKAPASFEAVALRQRIEVEDLNYKISRTRLWPKFNATIGMSQDEQNNYFGSGAKYRVISTYGGISLNWNIFDGFAAGAANRNILAQRRTLENDYRQLTERLAQDAQGQVKSAEFAARNMSINNRLLSSNADNVQVKNEEFKRGVRSEAEVTQARLYLHDARIAAYHARRSYLLSVGDFLGTIVEDPVLANLPAQ